MGFKMSFLSCRYSLVYVEFGVPPLVGAGLSIVLVCLRVLRSFSDEGLV